MKVSVERSSSPVEIAWLAARVCLPFRSRGWRGAAGAWQGLNQGSSIDFQDHRSYMPGDDPRHLDWSAYARTDYYTMKLFREEVSPRLDVAWDVSRSMALTAEKEARNLALLHLVLAAALYDGVNPRVYAIHSAGHWRRLDSPAAVALESMPLFDSAKRAATQLPLGEIPWRSGSLRVLISDLLAPESPAHQLTNLVRENGRPIVIAPYVKEEAEPDWHGNLELEDCETRQIRQQRVEPFLLARYRQNYRRHFELWREEARRRRIPLAQISCELPLGEAVRTEAMPAGVFEIRH